MTIKVLASGSKGNVTYIETKQTKILIDLGLGLKDLCLRLEKINVKASDIKYIFITHEHTDHIKGLVSFLKKYNPFLCTNQAFIDSLEELKDYSNLLLYEQEINLEDVRIEAIKTSHDARDSKGFVIRDENMSAVLLTDTGYINQKNWAALTNIDYYLIESNHDPLMLMNGTYPKYLKTRILSDYGHLSNQQTGFYLSKIIGDKTKKIILMHLSEQNNEEKLALNTVKAILEEHNIKIDDIKCAKQNEILEVCE